MIELQTGAMLFLFWNSITDIRKKEISSASVLVFAVLRFFCLSFCLSKGQTELSDAILGILTGMVPGLIVCAMGKASKGAIGIGDGIILTIAGVYIGLKQTITMIMCAFFLAFFWSVALLVSRKYTKNSRFPFVPFLFVGLMLSIWI